MSDSAAGSGGSKAGPPRAGSRQAGSRWGGRLRSWLAGRTLSARLIAGLLALLAVACACVGLVTYVALRGFLFHGLDGQLSAAKARYVNCVQHRGGPPPPPDYDDAPPPQVPHCGNEIPGQAAGTFSARLVKYTVTNAHIEAGRCNLDLADKAVLARLPVDGRPYDRDLPSAYGEYRLTAVRSSDGDVLVTGLPLGDLQQTLRSVELAEIAVFSAALLLTGVIGAGWIRVSLRPLRRVTTTAARVTMLVDDLLLLARLAAGRPLADDPVDLTRLAIDATGDARAAAPGHRWQLDLPAEPVVVRGDEQRLRQVLANLLSNAARHTPQGTTVTIGLADEGGSAGSPSGQRDLPGQRDPSGQRDRSEERRVGKECRSRWSPYH